MMGHPPEALTLHEKRVDAMLQLIAGSGGACATAHRRAQERLSGQDYDAEDYYDRWLIALRDILLDAGLMTETAVDRRVPALPPHPSDARARCAGSHQDSKRAG